MTGTKPTTRIAELPVRWLRDHMHEALTIYGLAMGYDAAVVAGRYGYAIQHTDRPGFRAVGAFADDPGRRAARRLRLRLPGRARPVVARPGPRRARPADGEEVAARRLRGLRAARPPRRTRARAWAGGCCTPCVADLPHPAALLSTPDADTKAFRLYHADGFVDLARGYHFPGDARPFAILGARLPLHPREPGPANS